MSVRHRRHESNRVLDLHEHSHQVGLHPRMAGCLGSRSRLSPPPVRPAARGRPGTGSRPPGRARLNCASSASVSRRDRMTKPSAAPATTSMVRRVCFQYSYQDADIQKGTAESRPGTFTSPRRLSASKVRKSPSGNTSVTTRHSSRPTGGTSVARASAVRLRSSSVVPPWHQNWLIGTRYVCTVAGIP